VPRGVLVLAAFLFGCRGTPPQQTQDFNLEALVDSLRPTVERAAGLAFLHPTRSALKSRDEVRDYLLIKLKEEFPPERQEAVEAVYRLLGLLPDSIDLRVLLLELYSEQVAGYYDPETSTLYGVRGADPTALRFVLAHELVHALQHQYLPLDSIMKLRGDADQQAAAQAVLEGQAMIASILAFAPDRSILDQPGFWEMAREQVRAQSTSMKVFATAPLALREGLIFPYLDGSEFMRWWDSAHVGHPLPTLAELPRSTEQILHPARYAAGDHPIPVRFAASVDSALFEDTMGELEIQILATVLRGGGEVLRDSPVGWGGDRYRVFRTPGGPALVWYVVWDDGESARRFAGGAGGRLKSLPRADYRTSIEIISGAPRPTLRIVIAPAEWERWGRLPLLAMSY
jgi:hypothetical protein